MTGIQKNKKNLKVPYRHILKLVGLVCIVLLLYTFDFSAVAKLWLQLDEKILLLLGILGFLTIILKFFRWHYLLIINSDARSWRTSFAIYNHGLFWSLVTPGRLGEFYKCRLVKERFEISYDVSVSLVFFDRLFDLFVLFAALLMGGITVLHVGVYISLAVVVVVVGGLVLMKYFLLRLIDILAKMGDRMGVALNRSALSTIVFRNFSIKGASPLAITFVAMVIMILQGYILSRMGYDMGFTVWQMVFIIPFLSISSIIPVSILGLGTNEILLLAVIKYCFPGQYLPEALIAFSISYSIISFVTAIIFSGLVVAVDYFKSPVVAGRRIRINSSVDLTNK